MFGSVFGSGSKSWGCMLVFGIVLVFVEVMKKKAEVDEVERKKKKNEIVASRLIVYSVQCTGH